MGMAWLLLLLGLGIAPGTSGMQASWDILYNKTTDSTFKIFPNYLYKDAYVTVSVVCTAGEIERDTTIEIQWALQEVDCMEQMYDTKHQVDSFMTVLRNDELKAIQASAKSKQQSHKDSNQQEAQENNLSGGGIPSKSRPMIAEGKKYEPVRRRRQIWPRRKNPPSDWNNNNGWPNDWNDNNNKQPSDWNDDNNNPPSDWNNNNKQPSDWNDDNNSPVDGNDNNNNPPSYWKDSSVPSEKSDNSKDVSRKGTGKSNEPHGMAGNNNTAPSGTPDDNSTPSDSTGNRDIPGLPGSPDHEAPSDAPVIQRTFHPSEDVDSTDEESAGFRTQKNFDDHDEDHLPNFEGKGDDDDSQFKNHEEADRNTNGKDYIAGNRNTTGATKVPAQPTRNPTSTPSTPKNDSQTEPVYNAPSTAQPTPTPNDKQEADEKLTSHAGTKTAEEVPAAGVDADADENQESNGNDDLERDKKGGHGMESPDENGELWSGRRRHKKKHHRKHPSHDIWGGSNRQDNDEDLDDEASGSKTSMQDKIDQFPDSEEDQNGGDDNENDKGAGSDDTTADETKGDGKTPGIGDMLRATRQPLKSSEETPKPGETEIGDKSSFPGDDDKGDQDADSKLGKESTDEKQSGSSSEDKSDPNKPKNRKVTPTGDEVHNGSGESSKSLLPTDKMETDAGESDLTSPKPSTVIMPAAGSSASFLPTTRPVDPGTKGYSKNKPDVASEAGPEYKKVRFQLSQPIRYKCGSGSQNIIRPFDESKNPYSIANMPADQQADPKALHVQQVDRDQGVTDEVPFRVVSAWETGMYHFMLRVSPGEANKTFYARVKVEMHGHHGYLSAIDWPLLPYNGLMAFLFLMLATVWMLIWARSHRHTQKIHIALGLIAVTGAMTHTLQFVQMATINSNGQGAAPLMWLARVMSVGQIAFISFVLMIVSTGYGITRPVIPRKMFCTMVFLSLTQLGLDLAWEICVDPEFKIQYNYPVVTKGILWGRAAAVLIIAGYIMFASIMTAIDLCRRRQDPTKIAVFCLYTISCAVAFASHLIMFGISMGFMKKCRKSWETEWLLSSFDHMESFILLIILMVLWRPQDENQSYAFKPLDNEMSLREAESDEDDDFEENANERQKFKLAPL